MKLNMNTRERIIHSILFEVIALCFMISATRLFTDVEFSSATGLAISLSLIAMCWNYIYNLGFDHKFGSERINRSFKMRIFHGLIFELGLTIITLPLMMWVLQLDFWTVFIMDIGLVLFFLIYAIIFNWCYDLIRGRITYIIHYSKTNKYE